MNTSRQAGFHIWLLILIIAAVVVIGIVAWRFIDKHLVNGAWNSDDFAAAYDCKDREVDFTSGPMKMEDLGYIRPLGAMLDAHVTPTDHVYVGPVKSDVPDNTYPVLMPADGTVVEVGRMPAEYIGDRDFDVPPEDHRIVMSFNCRYYSIYIHIHKLAEPLQKATEGLEAGKNKTVSIDLKAGDVVGYIGGSTFDWTPVDMETKLKGFIHPDLYKNESWKIHTVSPFDFYKGDLKAQLEAKSWRREAPIGGKIDYDEPGKLVGNWFREGTNGYEGSNRERYWDGHLSIVPDYIVPSFTIVSLGNWDGKAGQFLATPGFDPSKIGEKDGFVKVELKSLGYTNGDSDFNGNGFMSNVTPNVDQPIAGTIAFQVLTGEKLKVEKFIGKTPDQVTGFTAGAETFER